MSDPILTLATLRECVKYRIKDIQNTRDDIAKLTFTVEEKRASAFIVTINGVLNYGRKHKPEFSLTFKVQYYAIQAIKLSMPELFIEKAAKKIAGGEVESFDNALIEQIEAFDDQLTRINSLRDFTSYMRTVMGGLDSWLEEDFVEKSDDDDDEEDTDEDED